jgi:hypothetical protein
VHLADDALREATTRIGATITGGGDDGNVVPMPATGQRR